MDIYKCPNFISLFTLGYHFSSLFFTFQKPKKTNINIIQQYKLTNVTENSNKKIISNR